MEITTKVELFIPLVQSISIIIMYYINNSFYTLKGEKKIKIDKIEFSRW